MYPTVNFSENTFKLSKFRFDLLTLENKLGEWSSLSCSEATSDWSCILIWEHKQKYRVMQDLFLLEVMPVTAGLPGTLRWHISVPTQDHAAKSRECGKALWPSGHLLSHTEWFVTVLCLGFSVTTIARFYQVEEEKVLIPSLRVCTNWNNLPSSLSCWIVHVN